MDQLPEDPVMLLSFVNTALRDTFPGLDDFCASRGADRKALEEKLAGIDYFYDEKLNRFV